MPRVKRGLAHLKRRKNVLKEAKGFKWGRKNKFKLAKIALWRAGNFAYQGRKVKKRTARSLWLIKINAGCRENGTVYSKFIDDLKKNKIELDRKTLANLACNYPKVFTELVKSIKK
ncbi:MAG: 50S ribosomal protein L20 [Patescibacteria group bacterium]